LGFIKSAATVRKINRINNSILFLIGKQLELYTAIEVELLDLRGCDKKLQDYVAQYQANFELPNE